MLGYFIKLHANITLHYYMHNTCSDYKEKMHITSLLERYILSLTAVHVAAYGE